MGCPAPTRSLPGGKGSPLNFFLLTHWHRRQLAFRAGRHLPGHLSHQAAAEHVPCPGTPHQGCNASCSCEIIPGHCGPQPPPQQQLLVSVLSWGAGQCSSQGHRLWSRGAQGLTLPWNSSVSHRPHLLLGHRKSSSPLCLFCPSPPRTQNRAQAACQPQDPWGAAACAPSRRPTTLTQP